MTDCVAAMSISETMLNSFYCGLIFLEVGDVKTNVVAVAKMVQTKGSGLDVAMRK